MSRRVALALGMLWFVVFAAGVVGVVQRVLAGHGLAAYGSYVAWGLWVGIYFHSIGIAGGTYLFGVLHYLFADRDPGATVRLRVVLLVALVALAVGLLAIWFDLGRMARAWRILIDANFTSMMAFNAWMYVIFGVIAAAAFVLSYRRPSPWLRPLLLAGLPFAIAFPSQSGAFFGVVDAKPYWHTALFPVLFLMSALASGAAALTFLEGIVGAAIGPEGHRRRLEWLRRALLVTVLLYFVLEWSEISIAYWSPVSEHRDAWNLVLFGPFWWVFWVVHLGLGGLLPLALLLRGGRSPARLTAAGGLIAASFVSVRLNVLIPGQALEQIRGLQDAFHHWRLTYFYVATPHEYLVSLFLVAVGIGLVALGLLLLPNMTLRPLIATPAAGVRAPARGMVEHDR